VFSFTKKFSKPDQRASRTIAIKPDMTGVKQLDDGIGCIFVRAVLEKPCKKRTGRHVGNADKGPKEIICVEAPAYIVALDCAPH
jgi:hypothetical protein